MENYLSAGPLIIDQLKSEIPELANAIFSAADLEGVTEARQHAPALHVLYFGDRVIECRGSACTVEQLWYVVVVARNVKTQRSSEDARMEAGFIIKKVMKSLLGWRPSNEHDSLKRINGVSPAFGAGFAYIPLLFTTKLTA